MRFLARIAAQPSGAGSTAALELIELIALAALDRPAPADELDEMADGLRAELDAARPALAEAARLGRQGDIPVERLFADVDAGILLGGAYEPRWRGVARPLADSPTGRLAVAGDTLVTQEKDGLAFRSPHDGTPLRTFPWPGPADTWPAPGSIWSAIPVFADRAGPGVLTTDAGGRGPRRWRSDGSGWHAIPLDRPGLRLRPATRRVVAMAAHGGRCFVAYADNVVVPFDAGTGAPSGEPIPLPGPAIRLGAGAGDLLVLLAGRDLVRVDLSTGRPLITRLGRSTTLPVRYTEQGRPRLAFRSDRGLLRVDAETGAEVGAPIRAGDLWGVCAYAVGGRTCLAVTGHLQVHRFDAETGEPAGPPLFGHRRTVRDVVSAAVDGRPVLFSADGATVRRWDAATGTPWPAPLP